MINGIETIQRAVRERGPDGDYRDLGRIVVRRRDHLLIFNYTNQATFAREWTPVERVSRGLIIDGRTGEIVARPFDKFFNLGETTETQLERLPAERFEIFDKLDGSLGIIYQRADGWAVATRGSFDGPQATWATAWLREHRVMERADLPPGLTLLVEIIYPENRVVLDYGEKRGLVLLGGRYADTGEEISYDDLWITGRLLGLPVAERLEAVDIPDLLAHAGQARGVEGWVIRFAGGLRVKVKCDQYLALHRTIFGTTPERIREALLGGWGAYLVDVPEELRPGIEAQAESMRAIVRTQEAQLLQTLASLRAELGPGALRKAFALRIMADHQEHSAELFALLNGRPIRDMLLKKLDLEFLSACQAAPVEALPLPDGGELAAARDLLIRGIGLANELGEGERWAAWRGDVAQLLNQLT